LAAARVRVLTPHAMLSRLGDRLSILAGGASNLPERQQTLRGAIDWSYDLLETGDRMIFARMAIFAGGADLEAVEQVALAGWPPEAGPVPDALDAVTSLLDKSLLRQTITGDEPRFQMLGTIRAYALERLAELDAEGSVRRRHADYYAQLAAGHASKVFGEQQRESLDALEREHDNLRAAITFALEAPEPTLAMRLLSACWRFWQMRGYLAEAREQGDRIIALEGGAPEDRLPALDAAGGIAYWQGDLLTARNYYTRESELAGELGDEHALAEALYNVAFTYSLDPGEFEQARSIGQDALDRFRRLGDRAGEGKALWGVVNSYVFTDDADAALPLVEEAIQISREQGDRFQLGWGLFTRGLILAQMDEPARGLSSYREALEIFRQTEDVTGYALVLDGIAALHWRAGNEDLAMLLAGAAAQITDVGGIGLAKVNREAAQFFPEELFQRSELAGAFQEGRNTPIADALRLALEEELASAPTPERP
ncbi:MAG TPA: tetratricopeptide repeat protein, partial [Candidatus Limnocylindria bacterium]